MGFAIVLILLVIATVIFHFASPWYFTEIASNWGMIDTTVNITFWVTGAVFIAVNLFLAWVILKFNHHKGQAAHYEPENKKLEIWLTAITTLGVAAMLAPGLFVWAKFVEVPEGADEVEVVGQQWHWSYRYPGADGVLGKTDMALISVDNPFGVDPEDPNGADDRLVYDPELHLPMDRPVKLLLRSKDVLHDFAVAEFRVKMDLVPGMVTYMWLTPTREGTFDVLCEELCGIGHFAMRGRVVVESQESFETWLDQQPTFAQRQAMATGDPAVGQAQYAVCGACHGASGEGNMALNAPKLAGLDGWYIKKQIRNYQNGLRGTHESDVYGQQMAPMAATLVDEAAINNVIAYIDSFPDVIPAPTVHGDAERGADLYVTCSSCHGKQGQGIWSMNAPRTVGMSDWYIARQLNNFRQEIRGAHPRDKYGEQMVFMAKTLKDETAVNDLVAYLNTLEVPEK
ncbi:MAG: c-type cytochrome [Xanthomonadales bacterium]|nr:c-type cytochrome [Gammaproteobacteria bacterium]NNE06411.1 c-type cytochrome [Xanthomonadales bacterium]NNL95885.1 c-type cytochrome [Xanthomonadales bacterium]